MPIWFRGIPLSKRPDGLVPSDVGVRSYKGSEESLPCPHESDAKGVGLVGTGKVIIAGVA